MLLVVEDVLLYRVGLSESLQDFFFLLVVLKTQLVAVFFVAHKFFALNIKYGFALLEGGL